MSKEAVTRSSHNLQHRLEGINTALEKFDRIVESRGGILFMPKVSRIFQEPDYETRLRAVAEVAESRDRVVRAISRDGGLKDRLEERRKALAGSMSLSLEPPREPPSEEYIRELIPRIPLNPEQQRIIDFLLAEFQEGPERQSLAKRVFENRPAYTPVDQRLSKHLGRLKTKLNHHGVTIVGIPGESGGSTRYVFRWYKEPVNSSGKPPVISRTHGSEQPVMPPNGSRQATPQVNSSHKTPGNHDIHSESPLDEGQRGEVIDKIGNTLATTLISALVRSNQRLDSQYIPQLSRNILGTISATVVTGQERETALQGIASEEERKTALLASTISAIKNAWNNAQQEEIGDGADYRNIQYCSTLSKRGYSIDEVILLICSHFRMDTPASETPDPE